MEDCRGVDASGIAKVLDFWFGTPESEGYCQPRQAWFVKKAAFDLEVRSRFLPTYQQAAAGALDAWQDTPKGFLALIILLDQFPRNMFRNTPQSFATDAQALSLARKAIARHFDRELCFVQRWFLYLPLEHSENLQHQNECVRLFSQLAEEGDENSPVEWAQRHRAVIAQFGRFPHRNKILGRENTPEEEAFLQQPGSSF